MKQTYDNTKTWVFNGENKEVVAAYLPNNNLDDQKLWHHLSQIAFVRVFYISKYGKPNRTPRLTWAYGQVNANMPNPEYTGSPQDLMEKLRSIPNPVALEKKDLVEYKPLTSKFGLTFESEVMPPWLEELSQFCRKVAVMNWGFDPEYNSCIIGKYENGEDQIGFHTDDETFLAHHFCANVTIGCPRDFQFKTPNPDGTKQTHEICLGHKSIFFFLGLEHALPKRAGIQPGSIRYSISFRNMATNMGIGNSFYYCRGLAGAVDNEQKRIYQIRLAELQAEKQAENSVGMTEM